MLEEILPYLEALRLRKTKEILEDELKAAQAKKPSYSSFLLNLLRCEFEDKRNRALQNRIKQSGVPELWSLDTYPFHIQKGVDKKLHYELAELDFIARAENIVWVGATGVGKTGLASAILLKALSAGRTGRLIKAQDLFDDLSPSAADRSTRACLKRLSRLDVLLIDEMGYANPLPGQVNQFFRLLDSRYNKKPTLITTNLGYHHWAQFLGNATLAAALLRRLLHNCRTITFNKGVNLSTPKHPVPSAENKKD
jgi:DNA replication protein DnaC